MVTVGLLKREKVRWRRGPRKRRRERPMMGQGMGEERMERMIVERTMKRRRECSSKS